MTELLRLTQVMSEQRTPPPGTDAYATQALISCPMTESLRAELLGLIATIHNRMESKTLGASCLTRIYYEVLSLPQGAASNARRRARRRTASARGGLASSLSQPVSSPRASSLSSPAAPSGVPAREAARTATQSPNAGNRPVCSNHFFSTVKRVGFAWPLVSISRMTALSLSRIGETATASNCVET